MNKKGLKIALAINKINLSYLQENINIIIKAISAIIIPLIIYHRELLLVANEAIKSDSSSHIIAIPFLVGYMIYKKWKIIYAFQYFENKKSNASKIIYDHEIMGIILCIISVLLSWYGSIKFNTIELKMLSFPIFISGVILILFNYQILKTLLFPIAFLVFLIPIPVPFIQLIGSRLSTYSSEAAYIILKLFQIPVKLSYDLGSPIIILALQSGDTYSFAIDIACSGLYSFIGFTLFSFFVSYIIKGTIYKKIITIVLGYPLIYSLNIMRIIIIILIGHIFNTEIAINIFHLFGGWVLIFIGTIILFFISDKITKHNIISPENNICLHKNLNSKKEYCRDCGIFFKIRTNTISLRDIIKISVLILFSISMLFIQVPFFTLMGGGGDILVKTSSGDQESMEILPEIDEYDLFFSYRDIEFEKISGQDASLMYLYRPKNESTSTVWVGLEIGPTKGCLHPWEVCLITWPQKEGWEPKATKIELKYIQLIDDPPLSAKYFSYVDNDTNLTNSIIYWYTRSIFQTETGYEWKWVKNSVIKISARADHTSYELDLLPISLRIINYWEPINTWSPVTLNIARNGPILILVNILTSGFFLAYIKIKNEGKKEKIKSIKYKISSLKDLTILKTIKSLEGDISIEAKIATEYKKITGDDINLDVLEQILLEAEKMEIVSKRIKVINDNPYLIWVSNY